MSDWHGSVIDMESFMTHQSRKTRCTKRIVLWQTSGHSPKSHFARNSTIARLIRIKLAVHICETRNNTPMFFPYTLKCCLMAMLRKEKFYSLLEYLGNLNRFRSLACYNTFRINREVYGISEFRFALTKPV